jgi:hypothetical protein
MAAGRQKEVRLERPWVGVMLDAVNKKLLPSQEALLQSRRQDLVGISEAIVPQ